jgi:L-fucose mutarotase
MLRTPLLHPLLLRALASAGHGSQVLIADANYPHSTGIARDARMVYLNLSPGVVPATTVLGAVLSAITVEEAWAMAPDTGGEPPIFAEFRELLGSDVALRTLGRSEFYDAGRRPDVAVGIATGETRWYGNVLLTVGAISPA